MKTYENWKVHQGDQDSSCGSVCPWCTTRINNLGQGAPHISVATYKSEGISLCGEVVAGKPDSQKPVRRPQDSIALATSDCGVGLMH